MSLVELLSGVEAREKSLAVHTADEETVESVAERFADRNVRVTAATTESRRSGYAVLSVGHRVLAAASLPELVPDGGLTGPPASAGRSYEPILEELDETTFTSRDDRRMRATTREIEDRAWRTGGTLYAGFQRYSRLDERLSVYERLGRNPALDVTALAYPDAELSDHDDTFDVYPERTSELRDVRFVAFDGGGDEERKCALLAEEREPRRFYGVWTYDPETVDYVFDHVDDTYLDGASRGRRATGR